MFKKIFESCEDSIVKRVSNPRNEYIRSDLMIWVAFIV